MDTTIGTSQETLNRSLQPGSGLRDAESYGPRHHDVVWSMTPELQELAECDPGIISDLFSLFIQDSADRLQILSGACSGADFRIIRAQAHSLKGSSLQIGAAGLGSLCALLELSNNPEPDTCGFMLRAIDDEFALVRRAIERYLVVHGGLK
jgi:HPt (histidine-containing phosphotransfer) domain-containing protein